MEVCQRRWQEVWQDLKGMGELAWKCVKGGGKKFSEGSGAVAGSRVIYI